MTFHMQSKNCNKMKRDIGRHILNSLNFNKSWRGTALHLPNRYWSEIGLGSVFEEKDGSPPPGIARNTHRRKKSKAFYKLGPPLMTSQLIIRWTTKYSLLYYIFFSSENNNLFKNLKLIVRVFGQIVRMLEQTVRTFGQTVRTLEKPLAIR